jgi:hypothetical protein
MWLRGGVPRKGAASSCHIKIEEAPLPQPSRAGALSKAWLVHLVVAGFSSSRPQCEHLVKGAIRADPVGLAMFHNPRPTTDSELGRTPGQCYGFSTTSPTSVASPALT